MGKIMLDMIINPPPRRVRPISRVPSVNKPVTLRAAQTIMGRNYVPMFETDSFTSGFGMSNILLSQIMTSKGRLITESELIASHKTHVLMLVPEGSIMQLRTEVESRYFVPIFTPQTWYEQEAFAHERGRPGWHLIRKKLLGTDICPDWDVLRRLLPHDEETPTTRVMVYTLTRFFLATGERLAVDAYAHCSTFDSRGDRGKVGYFHREGFELAQGSCYKRTCVGNIGLAATKKQV